MASSPGGETGTVLCARCGKELELGRHAAYLVRIQAVADPTPPVVGEEDLQRDIQAEIRQLLRTMEDLSPREALDQVERTVVLHLCGGCYAVWIEDPAGCGP